MTVNYTPFSTLTYDELVREVCNTPTPTDLELELMERMTHYKEALDQYLPHDAADMFEKTQYVDSGG